MPPAAPYPLRASFACGRRARRGRVALAGSSSLRPGCGGGNVRPLLRSRAGPVPCAPPTNPAPAVRVVRWRRRSCHIAAAELGSERIGMTKMKEARTWLGNFNGGTVGRSKAIRMPKATAPAEASAVQVCSTRTPSRGRGEDSASGHNARSGRSRSPCVIPSRSALRRYPYRRSFLGRRAECSLFRSGHNGRFDAEDPGQHERPLVNGRQHADPARLHC